MHFLAEIWIPDYKEGDELDVVIGDILRPYSKWNDWAAGYMPEGECYEDYMSIVNGEEEIAYRLFDHYSIGGRFSKAHGDVGIVCHVSNIPDDFYCLTLICGNEIFDQDFSNKDREILDKLIIDKLHSLKKAGEGFLVSIDMHN
jgi:hypothetical protein